MSIVIKNRTIGEGRPLICVPIVSDSVDGIKKECNDILNKPVDMVEWRADFYLRCNHIESTVDAMDIIRNKLKYKPILFTYRTAYEGGEERFEESGKITPERYMTMIKYAADNLGPDIIDIEAGRACDRDMSELIAYVKSKNIAVISSMHDFDKTPEDTYMQEVFDRMNRLGADIFKIAVMPKSGKDVLTLMSFSETAKNRYPNPIITISMGRLGLVSRVAAELDGSAVTFASVGKASAPGQIDAVKLKKMLAEFSQSDDNIYLVGFMGCGKSAVAQELGRQTGLKVIDTDAQIVKREGMEISDIFADKGESAFRDIETNVLKEVSRKGGNIISCGGGIILRDENITVMKRHGIVILLTAEPDTIYRRICNDDKRPLLNDDMSVKHISDMLEKRRNFYEQAADIMIKTDAMTVAEIAQHLSTCYM